MFDPMSDVEIRIKNKENAMDQVCESLHIMKFWAIQTGDLRAIDNIRTNIEKHCLNRKKFNIG